MSRGKHDGIRDGSDARVSSLIERRVPSDFERIDVEAKLMQERHRIPEGETYDTRKSRCDELIAELDRLVPRQGDL